MTTHDHRYRTGRRQRPHGVAAQPRWRTGGIQAAVATLILIVLAGAGVALAASVSTPSLTFVAEVGSTHTQQVTVTNDADPPTGPAAVALQITGTGADRFAASGCAEELADGASCVVSVTFSPSAPGTSEAVLDIAVGEQPVQAVTLTGTGTPPPPPPPAPKAEVSPMSLEFSAQVGTTSAPKPVMLSNDGDGPLTVSSIAIGPDAVNFVIASESCPSELAAKASCTVNVVFDPEAVGSPEGTLKFSFSNGSPSTLEVALSGSSTAPPPPPPAAAVSPAGLDFEAEVGTTSAPKPVTLSNDGDGPLTVSSIAIGPDAVNFVIASESCPSELAAKASCTVNVVFDPEAVGPREGTLKFSFSNGSPSTLEVALSGNATAAKAVISAEQLAFAAQVGTTTPVQTVTLTNNGDAPLRVTGIAISRNAASFAIASEECPDTLVPGASCSVGVVFDPETVGSPEGTLKFSFSNGSQSTLEVALSGSSTAGPPPLAPVAQVAPGGVAFSAQPVGTTSGPVAVTLTNMGNAPLVIAEVAVVGAGAVSFAITNDCPASLAAGASCTVAVTFAPRAVGRSDATLRFTGNATVSTQSVQLTGTAGPALAPTAAPQNSAPAGGILGLQIIPSPGLPGPGPDRDRDGRPDAVDACPTVTGDLANGCQRELNADVRGVWQVNRLFTKIMDLSVRAPLGSRIEIRCVGARRGACPFTKKLIPRTTRRVTTLTRYFKRKRILAAGTVITVRVTRSGRIGTYERLVTRRGRKLPRVTVRCIDSTGRTVRCS